MLKISLCYALLCCGLLSGHLNANESPLKETVAEESRNEQVPLEVPEEFFVKERWFSLTSAFDVETRTMKLGTIHRRFISLTWQYDFYDVYEKIQANAKMRFFSFGPVFDIQDANEKPIGSVHQHFFAFFPTFEIFSAENHSQVRARLNFWRTKYTLRDSITNEEFATLSRPFFKFFKDFWTVKITNPELFASLNIDPRVFFVVMTFQTDKDNWRSRNNSLNMHIELLTGGNSYKNELSDLKKELASYRQRVNKVEPSEEDFAYTENFVEEFLAAHFISDELEQGDMSRIEEIEQEHTYLGLKQLIPLLNQDDLTEGQKNALIILIDNQLKSL